VECPFPAVKLFCHSALRDRQGRGSVDAWGLLRPIFNVGLQSLLTAKPVQTSWNRFAGIQAWSVWETSI